MRDAVHSRHETERGQFDPRDELRRYLKSPLADSETVVDIVGHWGVCSVRLLEAKRKLISAHRNSTRH